MVLLETLKMKSINLPDLATFIDVKDEYRNERSFSEQLNLMKASFYNSQNVPSLNEQDKFIDLFKDFGHMLSVLSTSTIMGLAPISRMASIVAIKLKACVITSSPLFTPKDKRAILIAAVPLETA